MPERSRRAAARASAALAWRRSRRSAPRRRADTCRSRVRTRCHNGSTCGPSRCARLRGCGFPKVGLQRGGRLFVRAAENACRSKSACINVHNAFVNPCSAEGTRGQSNQRSSGPRSAHTMPLPGAVDTSIQLCRREVVGSERTLAFHSL